MGCPFSSTERHIMKFLKDTVGFVKEHPWETGFIVMTGVATLALFRANQLVKVANHQSNELDRANDFFGRIAEAVINGWQIVVSEEVPNMIDIIVPEVTA